MVLVVTRPSNVRASESSTTASIDTAPHGLATGSGGRASHRSHSIIAHYDIDDAPDLSRIGRIERSAKDKAAIVWLPRRIRESEHDPMSFPDETGARQPESTPDEQAATDRHGARYRWEMEQARRRAVRDIVEQRIQEAREEGKFDNLSGAGKPLPCDASEVWAGDRALAYHLLKSNDVAPPELERGREIDQALERAEADLRALRHHRDILAARRTIYPSDRRAYNLQRDAIERRYEAALRAINSNILSLNITAPAALHRRSIPVERRMEGFRAEFPRVAE